MLTDQVALFSWSDALALNVIRPDSVSKKHFHRTDVSTTVRKAQPENWVSDAASALVLFMALDRMWQPGRPADHSEPITTVARIL